MTYVQFTQKFAQHFGIVVVVGNMRQEASIVLNHHIPIATVIIGTENLLVYLLGYVAQHIFALGSKVQFHLGTIGNGCCLIALLDLLHAAAQRVQIAVLIHL